MKSWSMQTFAVKDGIVFNLANLKILDFSPQPVPSEPPLALLLFVCTRLFWQRRGCAYSLSLALQREDEFRDSSQ